MSSWSEFKKQQEERERRETELQNQSKTSWSEFKKQQEERERQEIAINSQIQDTMPNIENQPKIQVGPSKKDNTNQSTTKKVSSILSKTSKENKIVSPKEAKGSKRIDLDIYNKTRNNAKNGNYIGYMADKVATELQGVGDSILNLYTTDMMKNNEKAKQLNTILGNEEQNKKIDETNNNLKELTNNTDYQVKRAGISFAETDFSEPVQLLGNAAGSVGAMLPSIAISTVSPTAGLITTGITSAGGAMKQAMDEGATPEQAQKVGILKGSVEIATEKLFGGVKFFGKGTLDDLFNEKVLDKVSSNIGKFAVRQGYDIVGETIEENLSNIAGYGIDKWILDKDLPKFEEILNDADETTKTTILSTILLKGLGATINKTNQNNFVDTDNLTKKQKEDIESVATMILEKEMLDNKENISNSILEGNNNQVQQITPTQDKNLLKSNLDSSFNIDSNSIYNTTAKQYNIDINNETVQTIDKITNQRGIQAKYDANIFENSNTNAVWRTSTDTNGKTVREIIINPNADSSKTLQNIIIHELTHDLEGTSEYNQLYDLIINYNERDVDYESARKSLEEIYSKVYDKKSNVFETLINQEAVADILGNKLGDQNFINTLTTEQPNLGKRIYNWIVDKLNKINKLTGYKSEKLFWTDIRNKFENAYKQAYQNDNKTNTNKKYSVVYNQDGSFNRVKINDNIFENNNGKSISNTIKDYLENHINEYTDIIESGQRVYLGQDLPGEYAFSKSSQKLPMAEKLAKGRASSGLKEIIENASSRNYEKNKKIKHSIDAKYGFYKYNTKFSFDYNGKEQIYEGTVVIRNDANGKKYLYDITNVKKIGSNLLPVTSNSQKSSVINGSSNSLPTNSITSQNKEVNTTAKYSMQESENNSGSFSLPKNIIENDIMKSYTINKPFKIAESYKIYRGISENGNTGTAMYGEGLYTTTNKNYAKKFGDVIEIDKSQLPKNPLQFRTETDFSQWEKELANSLRIKRNELYNNNNNVDMYVKQLGYDGITVGTGKDMTIVTYPQNKYSIQNSENSTWQEYLDKHFKNNGKGETIKDIKQPVLDWLDERGINYEVDEYNNIIDIEDPKALEEYYSKSRKTEKLVNWLDKKGIDYKVDGYGNVIDIEKLNVLEDFEKESNTKVNLPTIYDSYIQNNEEKINLLTKDDWKVINKVYEKQGKTEVLTEKRKAEILEKYANDKFKIKDSLDILAQKFVNKGHYIDQLSEKANNPELKFMYDRNLNSFAEAQYVIGVAQTDNRGNKIGKSINEIWKPIEDMKLTKEFSKYLLHKHNIDRSGRGKYVLGEDIGPTESTAIALDLEQKYPEFKQYAKDIKDFNHNNLMSLKEAGLLTQDMIEYLEGIYPNYVTISRDIEENIYAGDDKKTGVGVPIKEAVGGSTDIKPLKDTMAEQIIRIKKLINQNKLGQELAKTLKNAKIEQQANIEATPASLLEYDTLVETDNKGNKFYTYFENGIQQKLKINDNLYESLKPTQISKLEQTLPIKTLQKITSIHRSLLTSSNPLFIVTNFFKDFQDGMFNSKYASRFVKNYGKALNEVITKGKYYESYMANGGMTNTYFDYNEGITKQSNKFVQKIRNINEIVEQLPRLAEFISTLEDGKSLNEALYNAAEITTNFKRGGDIAKALNRNGANFLNASVQGFDKFYRNFSGNNGAKGYINILAKATIMGILPSIINHMLLSDDEDYQELPDSDKDLYYLFKYADGKFIRIPKGRILSIFGSVGRRVLEGIEGKENVWGGFENVAINQIAPNNPLEDNILAPVIQVKNNKTWYGSDLVSSRLEKELPENQYDETTDEFSKWLGKQLNASPKKINYLIDQYSGGLGDILLPMITPQAKENVFKDKFTTDSVLKNRHVSDFYSVLEKQTQIANDSFATDEDELQLKYLNNISKSMGELYKQKREIQMSDISNKEKTEQVRVIQKQINELAKEGLENYNTGTVKTNYAEIGNEQYYKNGKDEWLKLTDEEIKKNKDISIKTYADYKQKVYNTTQKKKETGKLKENQNLKTNDKIQILLESKYTDKEIVSIYENYIKSENDSEYEVLNKLNVNNNIKEYLKYKQQEFKSDYKEDGTDKGKPISGSEKQKVYEYVNKSKFTYNQRLLILGMKYKLTDSEREKVYNIVDSNTKLTVKEKLEIYKKFKGFTVYKDGRVSY